MFAQEIKCPFLLIKADRGPYYENKSRAEEFIELYKNNNKSFEYVEVEGSHHVHLNEPEEVIGPIKDFLTKYPHENVTSSKI